MLKGRVLLLNASYEVLGTVSITRAILLTLRDQNPATVVEVVPDKFLTSGGGKKFAVPSVIVLSNYIPVNENRRNAGAKRTRIYIRDGYRCQYCSVKVGQNHPSLGRLELKDLTLDHIMPRSRGGSNYPHNLVTACKPCNGRKDNRTPEEARMPLRTEIHETWNFGFDKLLICSYAESRPEWIPYLENQEGYAEILSRAA